MDGKKFNQGDYPSGTKLYCVEAATTIFTEGNVYEVLNNEALAGNSYSLHTTSSKFMLENYALTPHKWAKEIHAWADGAVIQWRSHCQAWSNTSGNAPLWASENEYRIKPVIDQIAIDNATTQLAEIKFGRAAITTRIKADRRALQWYDATIAKLDDKLINLKNGE